MSKISITRTFTFDAGHRVYLHESKCRNLHGHTYKAEITVEQHDPSSLDNLGRVIDFSIVKEKLGSWIDLYWDHGFILWEKDPLRNLWTGDLNGHKFFALSTNPTAENLASYLLHSVGPHLFRDTDVKVTKVTLWETPNCFATVSL